jgi:von Willebrand factor A domain-containing protein 8
VLDGIEKAERNVLPILNNLLENREMALDDGRFLVHPGRFDSLVASHKGSEMDKWKVCFFTTTVSIR